MPRPRVQILESQTQNLVTELVNLEFGTCKLQVQVPQKGPYQTVENLAGGSFSCCLAKILRFFLAFCGAGVALGGVEWMKTESGARRSRLGTALCSGSCGTLVPPCAGDQRVGAETSVAEKSRDVSACWRVQRDVLHDQRGHAVLTVGRAPPFARLTTQSDCLTDKLSTVPLVSGRAKYG